MSDQTKNTGHSVRWEKFEAKLNFRQPDYASVRPKIEDIQ